MSTLQAECPAKVNLVLSITGRRKDGFHELVSLVAPVKLADTLSIEVVGSGGVDTLLVSGMGVGESVPADADNLVLRAARAYREHTDELRQTSLVFRLQKRIPAGSGLGGGSSDAATALSLLNQLADSPLDAQALCVLAASLGSDCPLFLEGGGSLMRGRGEVLEPLPAAWVDALRGRELLLFRPHFSIHTVWAYQTLAGRAVGCYTPVPEAETRLGASLEGLDVEGFVPANDLAAVAFDKYLALPTLLEQLRADFGVVTQMTGSGSACFALDVRGVGLAALTRRIREAWGPDAWLCTTHFNT
ncbi:MAG: 4-(cytidine 5'-diphospho)-2-C-methyl-D-erythritol kinase [Opitutales bacterium]